MIDPTKMTRYGLKRHQLEETILFSVLAVQADAARSARSLDILLTEIRKFFGTRPIVRLAPFEPFKLIRSYLNEFSVDALRADMGEFGIGKHGMKSRAFYELAHSDLNLKTCTLEELEKIHGIGRKTSRFFVLHTRPGARVAALDTHILAYMRDQGFDIPKTAPGSAKRYRAIEEQFIGMADELGRDIAEFDLEIWNEYSKNGAK